MKCSGKHDTTQNIPSSITFFTLHFMLYRGKSISFEIVQKSSLRSPGLHGPAFIELSSSRQCFACVRNVGQSIHQTYKLNKYILYIHKYIFSSLVLCCFSLAKTFLYLSVTGLRLLNGHTWIALNLGTFFRAFRKRMSSSAHLWADELIYLF